MISVFDMFKIGIGPSSSHTVGPMKAGKQFIDDLIERHLLEKATHIQVDVYGSLSMTGFGHSTDIAIIMGLAGYLPHNVDIEGIPGFIAKVNKTTQLPLAEGKQVARFDPATDMIFHKTFLPLHENGMTITALADTAVLYKQTYYSIGGGFIVDEAHFNQQEEHPIKVPYPYANAADLLRHCQESGLSLSSLVMKNELALHSKAELENHLHQVWQTMKA